jgi:hypothetical protein
MLKVHSLVYSLGPAAEQEDQRREIYPEDRSQQTQAPQVVPIPSRASDDRFQGADWKGGAQPMVRYDRSAAVSVSIYVVTSPSPLEHETFLVQSSYEAPGCDPAGNFRHLLTTTEGEGHSTAPFSGSKGIGSPDAKRSSM